MTNNNLQGFEGVKSRLDEIVEAVSDESLSLDDALTLYEEAVELGIKATSLLEENLEESNARFDEKASGSEGSEDEQSDS